MSIHTISVSEYSTRECSIQRPDESLNINLISYIMVKASIAYDITLFLQWYYYVYANDNINVNTNNSLL